MSRFSFVLVLVVWTSAQSQVPNSIEELIESTVVRACDQINRRAQTPCANELRARARTAPPAIPSAAASRCDSSRRDSPESVSEQNVSMSAISKTEAEQAFAFVQRQRSRYALDGPGLADRVCAQRAQLVAVDLERHCQLQTAKLFVAPSRTLGVLPGLLKVTVNGRTYQWNNYHVANVVMVRENGRDRAYVLDPLLFDKPVPREEWEALVRSSDKKAVSSLRPASTYLLGETNEQISPGQPLSSIRAEQDLQEARRRAHLMSR